MPPPTGSWVRVGPTGKRRDWQPDLTHLGAVQGSECGTLTIPEKIGNHAITQEVRLWRGGRRIEFGVDLNTSQPDNGIFCIRFPIGMSGKVVAGIPFGVELRDNLEKEIFRGESFATGFPEGYDATRWTDVSSPKDGGYTFICPPGMFTGFLFKKSEQSIEFILDDFQPPAKDVFARAATSLSGMGHHRWQCACCRTPELGAMRNHTARRWSSTFRCWPGRPRAGSAEAASGRIPTRTSPTDPSKTFRPAPSSQAAASLVEVTPGNVVLSAMRLVPPPSPATGRRSNCVSTNRQAKRPM